MKTYLKTAALLILFGAGVHAARADNGCCSCNCRGRGLYNHAEFVPNVTYYAPYPYWFPRYFGPPYSDYNVVQYVTPPAESAAIVKERIRAINAANPALLPTPKPALPSPRPDKLPPSQK